jgi:hypothetical protein
MVGGPGVTINPDLLGVTAPAPGDPQGRDPEWLRLRLNDATLGEYINLRGREKARDILAADKVRDTDFEELYVDRAGLADLPTPEAMIQGILPRHSYAILRGRDGTYKSFVALDWSLCLATGKPWQGRSVQRGRVLYIAGEGAYGLAARVDAWEAAWGHTVDPDEFLIRTSALNLHRPGPAFTHLLGVIEERDVELVVIDTLRRVSGGADGNSSDMGAVVDNIDQIKHATIDGSVLVIAHTDKADNDSRGYSGIEDDADVVWHAKRDERVLALSNTKMKDGPDGEAITLAARSAHGSLILEAATAADASTNTASQVRILDTLRSTFRDGAYSGQLLEACRLPKTTFYRALGDLREAKHVVNTGTAQRPFLVLTLDGIPVSPTSSDAA